MSEWEQRTRELLIVYGLQIVGAILILALGYFAARLLRGGVRRGLRRARVEATLSAFVGHIVFMLAMAFTVVAALEKLGVDTTSFAAVVAAAGLAIGLALQGSLGNFAAGFMIMILRPFRVGDFVEVAGTSGAVEEITVFSTRLRTGDNKAVIIPNSSVTGDVIVNYSANPTRRIDLVFGVGYDDDVVEARRIIEEILAADERVLAEPAPVVAVSELADSSVNLIARPWVATADYWAVRWALTEKVKLAFDERGITIPFPQRDVHLHPANSEAA